MSPQLDSFLRSPETGPKKVVVGGTVRFLKKLVRAGNLFRSGYSADIVVAKGAGDKASVIVTKTKYFYEANAWIYQRDAKRLEWVKSALRDLGIQSNASVMSEPTTSSNTPNSIKVNTNRDELSSDQQPPRKKARTLLPLPKDVEVIELD